jgi:hypothetical protein
VPPHINLTFKPRSAPRVYCSKFMLSFNGGDAAFLCDVGFEPVQQGGADWSCRGVHQLPQRCSWRITSAVV